MSHTAERQRLLQNTDNYVILEGLLNTLTDEYPTTATATATLYNRLGTAIATITNVALSYVAGTVDEDTQYRGLIQDTVMTAANVPVGQYNMKVTASLAGVVREWNVPITVERG